MTWNPNGYLNTNRDQTSNSQFMTTKSRGKYRKKGEEGKFIIVKREDEKRMKLPETEMARHNDAINPRRCCCRRLRRRMSRRWCESTRLRKRRAMVVVDRRGTASQLGHHGDLVVLVLPWWERERESDRRFRWRRRNRNPLVRLCCGWRERE